MKDFAEDGGLALGHFNCGGGRGVQPVAEVEEAVDGTKEDFVFDR